MWMIAKARDIFLSGCELTSPSHAPDPLHPQSPWMPAQVPGTVLANLVGGGVYADPYIGFNSMKIPDIGEVGPQEYTYWYFCSFELHEEMPLPYWWLQLDGINYSFELFLNGKKVGVADDRGMFLRRCIDVSDLLEADGSNFMALLVRPPDHYGTIPPTGGQGGDHELAKDVASQFFQGWDWVIPVADRGTGVWSDILLKNTGRLVLQDAYAQSWLEPGDLGDLKAGKPVTGQSKFGVNITNASDEEITAVLTLQVQHTDTAFADSDEEFVVIDLLLKDTITIAPRQVVDFLFPPQSISNARLWWPNGMGEQPLYDLVMTVVTEEGDFSDGCQSRFGIRNLESFVDKATGGRKFRVNGSDVFVRGGNYICSDALLRQPRERVRSDVQLHAHANLNMMRCWGGAGCQRKPFYDACDEFGIMVWVEFWITGDDDGRGGGSADFPLDHELFMRCAEDLVRSVIPPPLFVPLRTSLPSISSLPPPQ